VPDVVVLGSLNLDLVVTVPQLPHPGETVAGTAAERRPGGKGANQAVATAKLGGSVRLAGLVGDDEFGDNLLKAAMENSVDVNNLGVVPGAATGTAFITVEDGGENMIVIASGANGELTPEVLGGPPVCGDF
jgi:ribokinase